MQLTIYQPAIIYVSVFFFYVLFYIIYFNELKLFFNP